jgi:hypothetical protein
MERRLAREENKSEESGRVGESSIECQDRKFSSSMSTWNVAGIFG